jgi:hypothetical protein
VQLGTGVMQGVHRPGESLRVANLSKLLRDCCCRSAQSPGTSTLRWFIEGLPQGVHAEGFSEGLESREKAQEV